jgi:pyruvate formate lyase activating enzyme
LIKYGGSFISSIDVPGKMTYVISTGGCPLRCQYCHNPELLESDNKVEIDELLKQMDDNCLFMDAFAITGGEPLMQDKEIPKLFEHAKELGLYTKLDTNGVYPFKLDKILDLVDYIALDIKAPWDKYLEVTGFDIGKNIKESMDIIYDSDVYLECRTTYVPALLSEEDIITISENIKCDLYTLQQFRNKTVLNPLLEDSREPEPDELRDIALRVKPNVNKVKIKTRQFGAELI